MFVRLTGLEPARRKTPDPKSDASTNSATGACGDSLRVQKYNVFVKYANYSAFFFLLSCNFTFLILPGFQDKVSFLRGTLFQQAACILNNSIDAKGEVSIGEGHMVVGFNAELR